MNYNKTITKNILADAACSVIDQVYTKNWKLNKFQYPINDNSIVITYQVRNPDHVRESLMTGFRSWILAAMRSMADDAGNRAWVFSRWPVGIYAMDYEGSRGGRYANDNVGQHIHATWVIHPHLRPMIEVQLDRMTEKHGNKFYWAPFDATKGSLKTTIHYSLKGVMHDGGFYRGRDDQYEIIGPTH